MLQVIWDTRGYFFWLLVISALCLILERIWPWRSQQKMVRRQFAQDLFWLFFNGHYVGVLVATVAAFLFAWPLPMLEKAKSLNFIADQPLYVQFIAFFLIKDFLEWTVHNLLHRVSWLWEFHKVHHSAEVLTPITAFRVHPVDDLLTLSLTALFSGVVQGLFRATVGTGIADIEVLGVNVLLFAWYIFGFHLRHSHIWLAYPVWLSHILVSPAQHQIHHSSAPRHFDRNMGFIFAFWDAIGGTLYVPKAREDLNYGLYGEEPGQFASVSALYIRPFRNLWAMRPRGAGQERIMPPTAAVRRPSV